MKHALAWCLAVGSASVPQGHALIEQGDADWERGARREARTAWLEAAESAHPVTIAMAEARLLQVSGNVGLAVHGPRMDAALSKCPPSVAWCALARHDAEFFTHRLGLGPGASAFELPLDADPELMDAQRRRTSWSEHPPPSHPTWTIGISPYGASGLGFGGALVFQHPDLSLRGGSLSAVAGATLSQDHLLAVTLDTASSLGLHLDARRQQISQTQPSDAATSLWQAHTLVLGPRGSTRRGDGWIGLVGWTDQVSGTTLNAFGASASAQRTLGEAVRVRWSGTATRGGTTLQYSTLDLTRTTRGHGLALRAIATGTRVQTAPTWRIPGWGGGTVLRHGRFLQYQSPILTAGVVEWRQPITPTWGATAFIEGGHASAWVGGVGSGIRLALPPRPSANLRLDIAWGGLLGETGSLGVSTGWGTAF